VHPLSDTQIRRYARHILLPDIGGAGQRLLLASAVVVPVGPDCAAEAVALVYLAAAGVGRLLLAGPASAPVTAAEAQAAIVYGPGDIGRPRLQAVAERVGRINPDVCVEPMEDVRGQDAAAGSERPVRRITPLSPLPAAWLDAWPAATPSVAPVADALVWGGVRAVQTLTRLLSDGAS
jgi:hypothetical protein